MVCFFFDKLFSKPLSFYYFSQEEHEFVSDLEDESDVEDIENGMYEYEEEDGDLLEGLETAEDISGDESSSEDEAAPKKRKSATANNNLAKKKKRGAYVEVEYEDEPLDNTKALAW
jgi:protein MAK16